MGLSSVLAQAKTVFCWTCIDELYKILPLKRETFSAHKSKRHENYSFIWLEYTFIQYGDVVVVHRGLAPPWASKCQGAMGSALRQQGSSLPGRQGYLNPLRERGKLRGHLGVALRQEHPTSLQCQGRSEKPEGQSVCWGQDEVSWG